MNGALYLRRWFGVLLLTCVSALVPRISSAENTLEPKVTEASLFKNGLGFVLRTVEVPKPDEYVIENLPVPVHGTLWAMTDSPDTRITRIVAFSKPRRVPAPAVSIADLLEANVGRRVQIKIRDEAWQAGTLVAAPQEPPELPISTAALNDSYGRERYEFRRPWRAYRAPAEPSNARQPQYYGFVFLRTEEGTVAVLSSSVTAVKSVDGELALELARPAPGAALRLSIEGKGGRLTIASLEWGLTWAPSYLIDVSDPKEAQVYCKGEVLNDCEELDNVTLQFVAGYPNLAYATVVGPSALIGDVADFVDSLMATARGGRSGEPAPAPATVQMAGDVAHLGGARPWAPEAPAGETRDDLFLYPQPGVTLARGERGSYPVLSRRVPYESLFRWQIEDSVDSRGYWTYDRQRREGQDAQPPEVWHVLRLTNAGDTPWTTAPAMVTQENRVLGQDTLYYTSPAAKTLVRVTRAADIGTQVVEREVERQTDALRRHGDLFDLVTVKGEARITSYKSKPLTVLIEKTLTGDVLETSPEPKIETLTDNLWLENPRRLLTWELPVEAGGELDLMFQYKVYVRR